MPAATRAAKKSSVPDEDTAAAAKPKPASKTPTGSKTKTAKAAPLPAAEVLPDAIAPEAAADPAYIAHLHGIRVPAAPHFRPKMIASLNAATYEEAEIACGLAAIPRGARILELGAGAGVVSAVLARALAPAAILSVEANPDLIPHIAALHAANGLSDVFTLRHAVVLTAPDAPDSIDFHVMGNFLGSGLTTRKAERARVVSVPVLRFETIRAEFAPDAIMMDIEGGELDFLRHADLSGINTFVAEFHRKIYGREGMRECRRALRAQGLRMDDDISRPGVHVYRR